MFPIRTRRAVERLVALATGTVLGLSALTVTVSTAGNAAAATAWAEPSGVTAQTYSKSVGAVTGQLFSELVPMGGAEYRQLLDIGHISGGSGDDLLAVTASGQLRLHPSSYTRPSAKYISLGGGWQTYNQVIVVGDPSGDGRADLMARDTHGRLWYYPSRNSLSDPFQPRIQVGTDWNIYDQLIGAARFDGTARGSLLARDLSGRLWLYDAASNGSLSGRRQIGTGWNVYNQLIGLDWNGDGHGDIIGRTEAGTLYAYYANGAGGYAGRVQVATGLASYNAIANEGHQPDFGKGQIIGRDAKGKVYAYTGSENGTLSGRQTIGYGYTPADFPLMTSTVAPDDNGQSGLVVTTSGDLLLNLEATGTSSFPAEHYTAVAGPGDLNGDGHADLITRDRGGDLWFIAGVKGGAVTGKPVFIGGGWNTYNRIVGAGDLTGDGIADIVATTPGGSLYLYPGLGNGKFGSRRYIGYGWQGYTKLAAPGDLTGDGKGDLAAVDSAGRLWLYPGLGNGHFGTRTEIGTGGWNGYHDIS
ncbi:VCBS repeat-containing protein [Streptomyces cynarae]|uniref:VCBS repeat-containing protein n=1 Tax=Streptomyces cynarae TaxID=2981134 RepID=A0ABY6E3K1_9ACTN|nr:VCBS repeat-containing protein [Streptomyces cynarae]UXY20396.1 VCBS repeat-containing protein [Streptomyces cynarae]